MKCDKCGGTIRTVDPVVQITADAQICSLCHADLRELTDLWLTIPAPKKIRRMDDGSLAIVVPLEGEIIGMGGSLM